MFQITMLEVIVFRISMLLRTMLQIRKNNIFSLPPRILRRLETTRGAGTIEWLAEGEEFMLVLTQRVLAAVS